MLKIGAVAPPFEAKATDGRIVRLADLRGGAVVLYFFPRAFTPGCTVETAGFRDNYDELRGLGAEVIGLSTDKLETQCRFAEAQRVSFPLIADEDRRIAKSFGVLWPLLPLARRITYILDGEGIVRAVFSHEFQVLRHLDDVRRFLEKMKRS